MKYRLWRWSAVRQKFVPLPVSYDQEDPQAAKRVFKWMAGWDCPIVIEYLEPRIQAPTADDLERIYSL